MKWVVAGGVSLLIWIDTLCTLQAFYFGVKELNPIWAYLLPYFDTFILVRFILSIFIGFAVFYVYDKLKEARTICWVLLIILLVVVIYHIYGLSLLG